MLKYIIAAACSYGTYMLLAPLAYAQRGYQAYGGEVMAAIAVGLIVILMGKRLSARRRQNH